MRPDGRQRHRHHPALLHLVLEHGTVDQIVDRREMRDRLAHLLAMLMKQPVPADDAEAA